MGIFKTLFPGKPNFPGFNLHDKVVIVTGGNTGIGFQMCKILLENDAKVYLAARSAEKAAKAIEILVKETGKHSVRFLHLDLASLSSCRSAAKTFVSQESALHVLFNNAGITQSKNGEKTRDGFEIQFGTNVLGHHVFTMGLMDVLLATAKREKEMGNDGGVRIVSSGSVSQYFSPKKEFKIEELESGGKSTSEETDLVRKRATIEWRIRVIHALFGQPISYGANQVIWVGTSKDVGKPEDQNNGSFYMPWMQRAEHVATVSDEALRDRLWEWLEEQRLHGRAEGEVLT